MKGFCLVVVCLALGAGAAAAQPVPAAPAAAGPDVPALNDAQKSAIRALQGESEQKTVQAAGQLAGIVQKIYENNLLDTPNEELRVTLDNQMRDLVWQMVSIKGNAMWTAFRLLTPEQKRIVRVEIAKPRPTGDLPDVLDLIVRTFQVTLR
jgi:hypothetical protein